MVGIKPRVCGTISPHLLEPRNQFMLPSRAFQAQHYPTIEPAASLECCMISGPLSVPEAAVTTPRGIVLWTGFTQSVAFTKPPNFARSEETASTAKPWLIS